MNIHQGKYNDTMIFPSYTMIFPSCYIVILYIILKLYELYEFTFTFKNYI